MGSSRSVRNYEPFDHGILDRTQTIGRYACWIYCIWYDACHYDVKRRWCLDNSKKYIEIEGACGGKGTETRKACIVGDTVGDPFKDTSGPALNILIKLMSMISLTIAPIIKGNGNWDVWYYGIIPIAISILATVFVYFYYWKDNQDIAAPIKTTTLSAQA